jgi:hypothetical protein
MTMLWSNNAATTIAGPLTTSNITITLAAGDGAKFPSPTGGDYFVATIYDQATKTINEIVHCTARSGDLVTVVRGQEGTTAEAWNAGDIFANLVTADTLRNFVQAGTGPADTSLIYVGTDISTTPGLIVCNTNPVPSNFAIGMQFNLKIANNNPGAMNAPGGGLQLNGQAAVSATRSNGSDMVGGDLIAGEEMIFIYNGTNFTSMISPVLIAPPVSTFYVNPAGNDNNSGLANTPAAAFATVNGAMNAIKSRYVSQDVITIRVADGTYLGGFGDSSSFIAGWNVIGNSANPGNVVIDASQTTAPAGTIGGTGCAADGPTYITLNGFTFKSYYSNISTATGGAIEATNCHFTAPVSGTSAITAYANSIVWVFGNCTFDSQGRVPAAIFGGSGGDVALGYNDIYQSYPLTFDFITPISVGSGVAEAVQNGAVLIATSVVSFTGYVPTGNKWYSALGGGISGVSIIPGSAAGVTVAPGWAA